VGHEGEKGQALKTPSTSTGVTQREELKEMKGSLIIIMKAALVFKPVLIGCILLGFCLILLDMCGFRHLKETTLRLCPFYLFIDAEKLLWCEHHPVDLVLFTVIPSGVNKSKAHL
jgi:hypothetical protein